MTFTKAELALALMTDLNFSRTDARLFVTDFFESLSKALEAGEGVKLSGIGKFVLRDKKARPGRNPKTREEVPVAARRVVTFQASQTLKKRIMELFFKKAQEKRSTKSTLSSIPPLEFLRSKATDESKTPILA